MDRRSLLGTGLGLGALLAQPPLARATPSAVRNASLRGPAFDLTTASGNVDAMAKLVADLDVSRSKHGWYDGVLVGVAPGGVTRELLGIRGMNSERLVRPSEGAGWLVLQKEVGFFTDLDTGKVLDHWRNPYTNEEVEPFHIANPAVNRPLSPVVRDTRFYDTVTGSEPHERPFILDWKLAGDHAFVEQRTHVYANNPLDPAVWKRESSGAHIQVADFQSYVVSLAALQDPKLTSVPYFGHWEHWRPWQPWMLMGARDGGCLYSATTGSASSLEELPPDLVALVRERAPEFLVAPTEVRKSEPSMVRYMRERRPAS